MQALNLDAGFFLFQSLMCAANFYKLAGLHELINTDNRIKNEKTQNNLILKFDDLLTRVYALFIIS
ncbi:hypothetical protein SAMN05661099_1061 [Daejeonella lutea]|uniref:Uncharacterized protein n=1 Tax=Daejeonella lutea TaxID=572036 RepID=A0A1T5AWA7_9SPHI|nr:hypothetical protein SAMN05661099_1061 [Daejeonella lutea]